MPRSAKTSRAFLIVTAGLWAMVTATVVDSSRVMAASPDFDALIAAPDRSDADRQTDKRRNPVNLLKFTGVETGMTVLDVGAGAGYSTELMVRGVGPTGKVYGQNTQERERFTERMKTPVMKNVVAVVRPYDDPAPPEARNLDLITFFFVYHDVTFMPVDRAAMKTPVMKNVVAVVRPYDDPAPPEARNLDLITFFFVYHDVTFMPVDRAAMNRKLFEALKPGGMLVIADHSAKTGDGTGVGKSLHRIEESALRKEVEAAGFVFVAAGDFLRNPEDKRDVTVSKSPVPVDEFVLKFQKPAR